MASLPTCCTESRPCAPSKSRAIQGESSPSGSPAWEYGTTCEPSAPTTPNAPVLSDGSANTRTTLSSPEASPAKTFRRLAKGLESRAKKAVCGASSRESFARFDPDSHSWKIPQCLFAGDLASFSGTWPRSGMMRGGTCWGLPMWVPDTNGSESGLPQNWPTVTVHGNDNVKGASPTSGDGLHTAILKRGGGWPTPTASGDLHYRLRGDTEGSKCLAAVVANADRARREEQRRAESMGEAHEGIECRGGSAVCGGGYSPPLISHAAHQLPLRRDGRMGQGSRTTPGGANHGRGSKGHD